MASDCIIQLKCHDRGNLKRKQIKSGPKCRLSFLGEVGVRSMAVPPECSVLPLCLQHPSCNFWFSAVLGSCWRREDRLHSGPSRGDEEQRCHQMNQNGPFGMNDKSLEWLTPLIKLSSRKPVWLVRVSKSD